VFINRKLFTNNAIAIINKMLFSVRNTMGKN
jgi:hypothetical protein